MRRRPTLVVLFACATLLRATAALGQDWPVVFAHGFNSKHEDWQQTADRLATELTITSHRMTTDWKSTIPNQAGQLQGHSTIGGLTLPIVVGHSNGGLVGREWSKTHPVKVIITFGTPHLGLPIIHHVPAYTGFLFELLDRLFNVIPWDLPTENWWVLQVLNPLLEYFYGLASDTIIELAARLWWRADVPVAGQMFPGAAYLRDNLNAVPNLNREVAEVPVRIGIVNVARDFFFGGPFRGLAPEYADEAAWTYYGAAFAMEVYAIRLVLTSSPGNTAAQTLANRMLTIAERIYAIDPYWCATVSTNLPLGTPFCLPNDGIVPFNTQVYPVAGSIRIDRTGPAHTQEKNQLHETIAYLLTTFFPVLPRWPASAAASAWRLVHRDGDATVDRRPVERRIDHVHCCHVGCRLRLDGCEQLGLVGGRAADERNRLRDRTGHGKRQQFERGPIRVDQRGRTDGRRQSVGCRLFVRALARRRDRGQICNERIGDRVDHRRRLRMDGRLECVVADGDRAGERDRQRNRAVRRGGEQQRRASHRNLERGGTHVYRLAERQRGTDRIDCPPRCQSPCLQRNVAVDIEATASDPDGNASVVEFLVDNVLLGADTSSSLHVNLTSAGASHDHRQGVRRCRQRHDDARRADCRQQPG